MRRCLSFRPASNQSPLPKSSGWPTYSRMPVWIGTAFLIALGGGVVGDLTGFLAAVYYRGIPYIQVPTTIVSQVDSAIGGKTGVNLTAGKNLLGAFHPPSLVLADIETLGSLPAREFNEGMAEAIKHAIICDQHLLTSLLALDRNDTQALGAVIHRNLEIKAKIVARDEFERGGERALLNFGHTIGHGIEQAAGYGRLLHGEAISLGMVAAARLSVRRAGLPMSHYAEIIAALHHFHLPVTLPEDVSTSAVLESMGKDKKFESGSIRFVLTPMLGKAFLSDRGSITRGDLQRETDDLRFPGCEVDCRACDLIRQSIPLVSSSAQVNIPRWDLGT